MLTKETPKESQDAFARIFAQVFDIPIKEEHTSYSFKVDNIEEINFNKVKDDLSYADPLRIVEYNNEVWAIVHHSIYDKKKRSIYNGRVHDAIIMCSHRIEKKKISEIVSQIKEIKLAKWYDKNSKVAFPLEVKVTKIKCS